MIVKFFELKNKDLKKNKYFLLYGNNKGLIEETIKNTLIPILSNNVSYYDESQILNNIENFKEDIFSQSFFDRERLIVIKRSTEKIYPVCEEIVEKNLKDISIIFISESLEKRSKLRLFFEKNNKTVCIPFYEDNQQTLSNIVQNHLKKLNINLSQQMINVIVDRSRGDRVNLNNELIKLENYSLNKKKIELDDILKLTNLAENHHISSLVDYSLAKNRTKTLNILNENNLNSEDCIYILRMFLSKLKRLLIIKNELREDNNIEKIISSHKPPIFWKDKELVKQQIKAWKYDNIKKQIVKTNSLELKIKRNPSASIFLVTDFILERTLEISN
ncbi:DNA polymerase III subunit delta [Candidatus Pelagibacter sp.]|nr:DNA polymerase III subunit delta [Candidatus Pelagibacter sp.]